MTYYIYKITNLINQKIYIGKTNNPKHRWYGHRWIAKDSSGKYRKLPINLAIHKYGENNFLFEIIDQSENEEEILQKEINYISDLKKINELYNITDGGNGVSSHIPTIETCLKISQSNKGKHAGNKNPMFGKGELVKGASNPFYGKEHNEKSKKQMSVKRQGNKNPRAILTETIVREIKTNKNNLSVKELATLYHISVPTIYKILDGTNWSHVV